MRTALKRSLQICDIVVAMTLARVMGRGFRCVVTRPRCGRLTIENQILRSSLLFLRCFASGKGGRACYKTTGSDDLKRGLRSPC
jgi:hypothetical protein